MNTDVNAFRGRKAIVTGGLGFIGSTLSRKLVELGAAVTIADNLTPACGGNPYNIKGIESGVNVVRTDIRDAAGMEKAVRDADYVFHLAALLSHTGSMKDPAEDFSVNCCGTISVLEACRKACPGAKVVYAGTRGQYGRILRTPVDECHPTKPADMNGISKQAGEDYVMLYGSLHGKRVTSLRLTNVYGPRHQMRTPQQGFAGWFVRLALDGEKLQVMGGGQERDLLYVDDAVSAMLLAASSGKADGEVFNVGSGKAGSVMDYAKTLVRIAGSGSCEVVEMPPERKGIEIGSYVSDVSKIKKLLGWKPQVSLNEGLKRTVSFYREHGASYWPKK